MVGEQMLSLYQVQKAYWYERNCWNSMSSRRRKSTPRPDLAFAYRVLSGQEKSLAESLRRREPAFV